MAKIIPITEHYQHFLAEMKESFWGDVYGETRFPTPGTSRSMTNLGMHKC